MLLNLSSDVPFFFNKEFHFLKRKTLENDLPIFFYKNKKNFKDIYIINGPGYFSSTRIGVEIINILKTLNLFENIYYLNKIEFWQQLGFNDIYLFSGNKNKYIHIRSNNIIKKENIDYLKKIEELFELELKEGKFIYYNNIINDYKKLNWHKLKKNKSLKPFYIFQPITS